MDTEEIVHVDIGKGLSFKIFSFHFSSTKLIQAKMHRIKKEKKKNIVFLQSLKYKQTGGPSIISYTVSGNVFKRETPRKKE